MPLIKYLFSNLKFQIFASKSVKWKSKPLTKIPFVGFHCTRINFLNTPKDTAEKNNVKNTKKLEHIPDQLPDITDDENYERNFWKEYEKKMALERKEEMSLPYPDRMRYRKVYKNPIERTFGILRDDILQYFGRLKYKPVLKIRDKQYMPNFKMHKEEIFPNYCDVVIIGGGLVGACIAFHLQERAMNSLRIVMVEKDLSYSRASSVLSVGGFRQQFSTPENIVLSKYGMDFLKLAKERLHIEGSDPPNISINFNGYLTLASESGAPQLLENYRLQRSHQSSVELMSKQKLKSNFPWLNVDGIEAGVYGVQREGWIDPWSLLLAVNHKTRELGTCFVNGSVISSSKMPLGDRVMVQTTPQTVYRLMDVQVKIPNGEIRPIHAAFYVIAAGCSSKDVGHLLGIGTAKEGNLSYSIPVEPRKRFVYCVKSPDGPGLNCPLVVDPTGAYFRREGLADMYLCGQCPPEDMEPSIDDLSVDYSFFEDKIWPIIANRCPSFEKLKMQSSWAGFYDYNTFDQNALIGRHPMFSNVFMATGFSGHGIQQAPGAGLALSEIILDGEYSTLNLERFGFERFILNEPIRESCVY